MARQRVVSRTINSYKVVAQTADLVAGKVVEMVYYVPAQISAEKLMDYIRKHESTESTVPVAVVSVTTESQIYAMTEADFLKVARPMTPDRKFIDSTGELVEAEEE